MSEQIQDQTHEDVRHYYGEVLSSSADLKTSACCPTEAMPPAYRGLVNKINPEILDKFYGCGSPLPFALEGCTVLDLGCGTGRDAYMLAALVGPKGRVYGVDMTEAQLAVANRHLDEQMKRFGYAQPNISFHHGKIEDLASVGIVDASIDVVVSNCVINLSPQKEAVFREIFRVLKPGGELYFADIFAGRRIPDHLAADPVLRGECLGGAMYIEDFRRLLADLDCRDYRVLSSSTLEIHNPEVERAIGMIDFYSQTVRAFKVDLEDRCENYGQVVRYLGSLDASPHAFQFDDHYLFPTGMPVPVCGNTAAMLQETRYRPHFQIDGDRTHHFGLFTVPPLSNQEDSSPCC